MNGKKAGRAFLISILIYVVILNAIAFFFPRLVSNIVTSNLLSEAAIGLPVLLFVFFSTGKFSGEKLPEETMTAFLGFKKIRPATLLSIIPFTMFSLPFITLINLFSQFWVKNEAAAMMENFQITQLPFLQVFFSVGIFAPLIEEVICRGAYYRSYKKSAGMFRAMLVSALIFALVHMNFNQAAYAFAVGILAVLLVEATGSLWSGIVYHGLINSSQVAMMYFAMKFTPQAYSQAEEMMTTQSMVYAVAAYLIFSAITLPIAWALLVWMSGHEGRRGILSALWESRKEKKQGKVITVSLALGVVLCLLMMTLNQLLPLLLKMLT